MNTPLEETANTNTLGNIIQTSTAICPAHEVKPGNLRHGCSDHKQSHELEMK
jgi:hypothetical protein